MIHVKRNFKLGIRPHFKTDHKLLLITNVGDLIQFCHYLAEISTNQIMFIVSHSNPSLQRTGKRLADVKNNDCYGKLQYSILMPKWSIS